MPKKICKTFYCLKISGSLRLLDYYGSCAPDCTSIVGLLSNNNCYRVYLW